MFQSSPSRVDRRYNISGWSFLALPESDAGFTQNDRGWGMVRINMAIPLWELRNRRFARIEKKSQDFFVGLLVHLFFLGPNQNKKLFQTWKKLNKKFPTRFIRKELLRRLVFSLISWNACYPKVSVTRKKKKKKTGKNSVGKRFAKMVFERTIPPFFFLPSLFLLHQNAHPTRSFLRACFLVNREGELRNNKG